MDIKSFDAARIEADLAKSALHEIKPKKPEKACCAGKECRHGAHPDRMETVMLPMPHLYDREAMDRKMRRLLWKEIAADEKNAALNKLEIVRLKGVLAFAGTDRRTVIQAVYQTYEWIETVPWASPRAYQSEAKLVVIGKHLDVAALEAYFRPEQKLNES